ncbi:16S rRNA (cytidine(1402)-2'-O)-methyltransferase [candidate division WWE3 bacterium]|uniref:16S rRNA (Cytidine(1402)-2'-O)-methyltransferase n=1 Tax=candidate division WWE3 bacterium TaxID=2053526 RepID=A0A955LHJ3_UNCKA|nr:16S rRNA (cytidine(1402)-2'-O)-methyltransferase [candidate division WWE3 bacterium]
MGRLTIIATPIGNLEDISQRAISALKEADFLLAEDTRKLSKLIQAISSTYADIEIQGQKIRFDDHTEQKEIPRVIEWLDQNLNVVLVSDAGTPLVSDPGFYLVKTLTRLGTHEITSIPGPSAVTNALVLSGLPPYPFMFLGYLPKKKGELLSKFSTSKAIHDEISTTFICFESPYRIIQTLKILSESEFKDIKIVILSEMTKQYEKRLSGTAEALISALEEYYAQPKGEFVMLWHFG